MEIVVVLKALANERRLQILEWLRDPRAHFRAQVDGDLVEDGVCGVLIAEKLGVSAATLSEHMRVLVGARSPSGEGRLAVGGLRMRDAGSELELAIAQDRCLMRRPRCWG